LVLVKVTSYLGTGDKGGRRRNKRFWGWGLHANWRRRSNRKRRVILWSWGWGSSEIEGRGDKSWENDVGNGP
jgi:hypothetical protein